MDTVKADNSMFKRYKMPRQIGSLFAAAGLLLATLTILPVARAQSLTTLFPFDYTHGAVLAAT